jgi:hypothetical protein
MKYTLLGNKGEKYNLKVIYVQHVKVFFLLVYILAIFSLFEGIFICI